MTGIRRRNNVRKGGLGVGHAALVAEPVVEASGGWLNDPWLREERGDIVLQAMEVRLAGALRDAHVDRIVPCGVHLCDEEGRADARMLTAAVRKWFGALLRRSSVVV